MLLALALAPGLSPAVMAARSCQRVSCYQPCRSLVTSHSFIRVTYQALPRPLWLQHSARRHIRHRHHPLLCLSRSRGTLTSRVNFPVMPRSMLLCKLLRLLRVSACQPSLPTVVLRPPIPTTQSKHWPVFMTCCLAHKNRHRCWRCPLTELSTSLTRACRT